MDIDGRIEQGLYRILQAVGEINAALEDVSEVDAGQYLREAANRLYELRRLIWPVYQAVKLQHKRDEGECGE